MRLVSGKIHGIIESSHPVHSLRLLTKSDLMLKHTVAAICLLGLTSITHASVNIEIDAGLLETALGTSTIPANGLLQLITTPSGSPANFSAPTATSFTSGDNVVLESFAANFKSSGVTGEIDNTFTITLQNTGASTPTTFDQGDPLLLRWYPSLTTSSTAPGLGTTYGQFTSTTGETVGSVSGSAWATPADSQSITLLFITQNDGGSYANTLGQANNMVNAVPEPSTYFMVGFIALGVAGAARWQGGVKLR